MSDRFDSPLYEVSIDAPTKHGSTIRLFFREAIGLDAEATIPLPGRKEGTTRFGAQRFPHVILKHGVATSSALWDWYAQAREGPLPRTRVSIVLLNEAREGVRAWTFASGLPVKIEPSELNAKGNEIAIDTLELCHDGLTLETP